MKFIAILLVLNSHSSALYPDKIKILSTGGALGNTIFFVISGYLTNFEHGSTFRNFIYRFLRLYLPLYIFLLFMGNFEKFTDIKSAFNILLWPTAYWFVSASLVNFILLRFLDKISLLDKRNFYIISILFIISYVICYIFIGDDEKFLGSGVEFIRYIYCFYMYYLGYYMKKYNLEYSLRTAKIIIFSSFILVYVSYFARRYIKVFNVVNHFSLIAFAVGILIFAIEYENSYNRLSKKFIRYFNLLGVISLEAYIVQRSLISFLAKMNKIIFPINLIILIILVFLSAYILHLISNFVINFISKKLL